MAEFPEVDRAEWFGLEEAKMKVISAQRELLERLKDEKKLRALRSAIDEGDASGLARGDVFARIRKRLGLPQEKSAPRGKMK
jgi:hypothetical protein